jgi:hypothetical protein
MENMNLTDMEINKITEKSKPREKAFYTFIRQSGLKPNTVRRLKIKHVEGITDSDTPIPCKIEVPNEIEKSKFRRHPSFIAEEAIKYLKKYLTKREVHEKEKLTPESLIFIIHNKPNKPITVKEIGRTFKKTANKIRKGKPDELQLPALREFFKQKSEEMGHNHVKYLMGDTPNNNYKPEDDEFYRKLYKEAVMDSLEIEPITKSMLRMRDNQIKDLKQKFDYLLTGYQSLQHLAKPIIDFHSKKEDGEMTIHLKQRTVVDPLEEARRIDQEMEEEKNNQQSEDRTSSPNQMGASQSKKKAELDEWQKAKETIDKTPTVPKPGETYRIIWGDIKAVETRVEYHKTPTPETNNSIRHHPEAKNNQQIKQVKHSIKSKKAK